MFCSFTLMLKMSQKFACKTPSVLAGVFALASHQ